MHLIHDPYTGEGRKRYLEATERFRKLTRHEWFESFLKVRRSIKVVDLCGGTGIGGVALCKVLMDRGYSTTLTIIDVRESVKEVALRFSREELGREANFIVGDIRELDHLEGKADIMLIYGASTIYFSPWDWVKILARIIKNTVSDGLFINDDVDKMYTIIYMRGFKEFIVEEKTEDKLIVSIHGDYDFINGVFIRKFYDILRREYAGELPLFFWSIADLAAYTWLFFKDVDIIFDDPLKPWKGKAFILAKEPRTILINEKLDSIIPRVLMKRRIR